MIKAGTKVKVQQNAFVWYGRVSHVEKGYGKDEWFAVEPDDFSVHARLGTSPAMRTQNVIMIPSFSKSIARVF